MRADPTSQEMHRLFVAKADGVITPEEHDRLSALLKDSAAARREWFAFQDAEAALQAWSQREALRRERASGLRAGDARGGEPDGRPSTVRSISKRLLPRS